MNLFSPAEIVTNYAAMRQKKASMSSAQTLLLGIFAGCMIAFAGVAANTASHTITDVSTARIINGLLFPFGLGMVVLTGAELFTGNCLLVIGRFERKMTMSQILKNWCLVYLGNLIGSVAVAFGCAYFGQFDYSAGGLAVFTVKIAAAKTMIPFGNGVVLGFFCNFLVALGVIMSLSAKDTVGKIIGAYLPVACFVISGFEHCIANMYYIPAAIFAINTSKYTEQIAAAGIDISSLNWVNFVSSNLLPVTIGNILGGVAVATLMWVGHRYSKKQEGIK